MIASLAETGSDGRFRLEDIPPGTYTVSAGPLTGATFFSRVITVAAGAVIADVDFVYSGPVSVTLSGRVIREPGASVLSNQVVLTGTGKNATTTAAADGSFEFRNVLSGSYNLVVSAYRMPPLVLTVLDTDVTGIELKPPLIVDVNGTVTTSGGGLHPRVTVRFQGITSPAPGGVVTPTGASVVSGNQTFKAQLSEGLYRVTVINAPAGYTIVSITAGAADLRSLPLQIAGRAPPPLLVTLQPSNPAPWSAVRGRVENLPDIPADARVTLWGILPNLEVAETPLGPDGSFEFPMILPGEYRVYVTPVPAVLKDRPLSVRVPPGGLDDLRVSAPITKVIPGRIVVERDGPPPRLALTISSAYSGVSSLIVTPAPDGTFTLSLPEDDYRIGWQVPAVSGFSFPAGYAAQSMTYGSANLFRDALIVSRTNDSELRIVLGATSSAWSKVSGRIVGLPQGSTGARINITGSSVFTLPDAIAGADGAFEFPKVPQGAYTLRLFAGEQGNPIATKPISVGAQDLTGIEIVVKGN